MTLKSVFTGVAVVLLSLQARLVREKGMVVEFSEEGRSVGILRAEEGVYVDGVWRPGRRMNGDQDHQGRHIRIAVGDWGIQRVKVYTY